MELLRQINNRLLEKPQVLGYIGIAILTLVNIVCVISLINY